MARRVDEQQFTKEVFLNRLRNMLTNRNEPCTYCPCSKNYNPEVEPNYDNCRMCQVIMGLKYKPTWDGGKQCPCTRLGKEKAVSRAWEIIRDVDNARLAK